MASASAASTPSLPLDDGALTHQQILTILIGLMMGMFLAALDQTIVATAIRTIADDLHGLSVQAWVDHGVPDHLDDRDPALRQARRDIYGRKTLFLIAIIDLHRRLGAVLASPRRCTSWPRSAPSRASAPAACSRWRWRSSATSCRRGSARKYQGYFLAVFGTSSVLGPVIGGFFAGQDDDPRHHRLALGLPGQRADRHRRARRRHRTLHLPHTRRDHRIDWWGAVALIVGLVPLLIVAEQGRELGLGLRPRSIACYVIGVVGLVAFVLRRARGWATRR